MCEGEIKTLGYQLLPAMAWRFQLRLETLKRKISQLPLLKHWNYEKKKITFSRDAVKENYFLLVKTGGSVLCLSSSYVTFCLLQILENCIPLPSPLKRIQVGLSTTWPRDQSSGNLVHLKTCFKKSGGGGNYPNTFALPRSPSPSGFFYSAPAICTRKPARFMRL